MVRRTHLRAAAVLLAGALPFGAVVASDAAAPVQSLWQPQEIKYSYMGFTTAYNCDAFETKLETILKRLGAHPETQVRATGCEFNVPSRNFFVTVTTATAVPASEAAAKAIKTGTHTESQQKLLDKLGVKKPFSTDAFPAQWTTVDLAKDRKMDLQPGDCELMEGLRDQLLPKLSIKIVMESVHCTPKQLSIQTPPLTVSALVPLPSVDKGSVDKPMKPTA